MGGRAGPKELLHLVEVNVIHTWFDLRPRLRLRPSLGVCVLGGGHCLRFH